MSSPATGQSTEQTETGPYRAPKLTLRVCFSGHRAEHLKKEEVDLELLSRRCAEVLALLEQCFVRARESLGQTADYVDLTTPAKLRFVSSLANGGDFMAVNAAIKQGYDLNLVLPFSAERFVETQEFDEKDKAEFYRIWDTAENGDGPLGNATRTEIDLGQNEANLSPYASCGRLMLDHADVLIALWDEKTDKGPGGTRDVMRDAQRRGQIIVRIRLDGSVGVWVPNTNAADPSIDGVFTDLENEFENTEAEQIEAGLRQLILPPKTEKPKDGEKVKNEVFRSGALKWPWKGADWISKKITDAIYGSYAKERSLEGRLRDFKAEKPRAWTMFSGFYVLQTLFGVREFFRPVLRFGNEDDTSWQDLKKKSAEIGGIAFSDAISKTVFPLWHHADQLAIYFSHVFRTAYILSFILSVVAVGAGLFIVFEADKNVIYEKKGILVTTELSILLIVLLLVYLGARQRWQKRWIDYRSLAEILRSTRLPLLIGSVPARSGALQDGGAENSWIAWYVRSHLRAIPPPSGRLDPNHLKSAIEFATKHEISDQIDYHTKNAARLSKLDHRMHILATGLLVATVLGGVAYLILLYTDQSELYKSLKPHVTFFGGILPVCGAAINGIRATGDFRSAADQSKRTAEALSGLRSRLEAEYRLDEPRRFLVRMLLNEAVRVMADDLNIWSMIYSQRELSPGVV